MISPQVVETERQPFLDQDNQLIQGLTGEQITRFNPTTYGAPTLGHAFMALVNIAEAARSNGRSIFRAENNQYRWLRHGHGYNDPGFTVEQMTEIAYQWINLFGWLGINFDEYSFQHTREAECQEAVKGLFRGYNIYNPHWAYAVDFPSGDGNTYADLHWYIAETVWWDHQNDVTLLIAGQDLLPRFSGYRLIERMFGYSKFPHFYLPRLRDPDGEISKTKGKQTIQSYKDRGYNANEVLDILRRGCLVDYSGPWALSNIVQSPQIPDTLTEYD